MAGIKKIEADLLELKQSVAVLRREAVETRGTMNRLVGVLHDLHNVLEGLRLEMQYVRTTRERDERFTDFAKAANQGGTDG
jgi:hypothetical protein